jgi:hypothetical protein
MTTLATRPGPNGRVARPSLGDQLDRLDGILNGLADALNQSVTTAVAAAVGNAVRQAVEAATREMAARSAPQASVFTDSEASVVANFNGEVPAGDAPLGKNLQRTRASAPTRRTSWACSTYTATCGSGAPTLFQGVRSGWPWAGAGTTAVSPVGWRSAETRCRRTGAVTTASGLSEFSSGSPQSQLAARNSHDGAGGNAAGIAPPAGRPGRDRSRFAGRVGERVV